MFVRGEKQVNYWVMHTNLNAFRILAAAALCGGMAVTAGAQVVANSITDFSGVQGQGGWFYGYYNGAQNPSGFVQFPTFAAARSEWERTPSAWAGDNPGYYVTTAANFGHPHAIAGGFTQVNSAVRRWVSPIAGSVVLEGSFKKTSTFFSGVQDGIIGRVFIDGTQAFTVTIPATDDAIRTFSLPTCLAVGTVVDMAVDPGANEFSDGTEFSMTVRRTAPMVADGPLPKMTCPNQITAFGVMVTGGQAGSPLTYRWQIQSVAGGTWQEFMGGQVLAIACPDGTGSSGGTAEAAQSSTATVLMRVKPCTGGTVNAAAPTTYGVRCIVSDGCSSVTSNVVTLTVCPADFNCSSAVTVQDVFDFLAAWFDGDARADINAAGGVTVQDVFDFLAAWFQGC